VKGKKVKIEKYTDKAQDDYCDMYAAVNWYVKQVRFPEGQTNITRIRYKSSLYGVINSGLYLIEDM